MPNFHWLDQIAVPARDWVGNQAFYLYQLQQQGLPVLPSLVITTPAFQAFIESIDWLEPLFADLPNSSLHIDANNPQQLQAIAQQIREEIFATELTADWLSELDTAVARLPTSTLLLRPSLAVKPGVTVKLPPDAITLLDQQFCTTQPAAIATALKSLWIEPFRAKSLLYWQRQAIPLEKLSLAVVLQPLPPALISGTVTVQDGQCWVQATWGLGTAIAWGDVVPDRYHLDLTQGTLQRQQLGLKTCAHTLATTDTSVLPFLAGAHVATLPVTDNHIQIVWLSEQQQQQHTLTADLLQELLQMARQVNTTLGPSFQFEWTLASFLATTPRLYLTQMNLHMSDLEAAIASPVSASITSSQSEPAVPPANTSTVAIKGLAAAIGQVSGEVLRVTAQEPLPDSLPPNCILVTTSITPDWLPLLKQAVGLIAEQGGMTSHGAIIARELGIPAVVGAARAAQILHTGQWVFLDGNRGEIYGLAHPLSGDSHSQSAESSKRDRPLPEQFSSLPMREKEMEQPNDTSPPDRDRLPLIATQLLANISQTQSIDRLNQLPIDGIGLLRSELMILETLENQHPNLWLQTGRQQEFVERMAAQIIQFAKAIAPRPLFYRALDLRSHEFHALQGSQTPPETNPMLGVRGAFSYLVDSALFDLELAALAEVCHLGYSNLRLLLPFVRTVEEFSFCRQRVERLGLTQHAGFQLWIMAEVPSVLFLLPEYVAAGVQGISIGTNDLTQLLLGVDRDQPEMAIAFDERHPAVLRAIAQLIQQAHQANIPCSICGQAPAQYPELIDHLIRWGIHSISVDVEAVESTYWAIARAEQRLLLEAARSQIQKRE